MERDEEASEVKYAGYNFNSRAHVERDQKLIYQVEEIIDFNSRAHVERDLLLHKLQVQTSAFQLTRSRGARQVQRTTQM